jgi:hypothetical protein
MIPNADFKSIFHQYVSSNAHTQEDMACSPQQLYQGVEKTELLRSSGGAGLLRSSGSLSRWGGLKEVDNMVVEKIGGTPGCCDKDMELIEKTGFREVFCTISHTPVISIRN